MAADETLNFDWDDLGEVERSEAVLETLETLFERLDAHIDLANRLDKTNPFVVERVMQGCLAVVDMLYTGRQNTCVDAAAYYQVAAVPWHSLQPLPSPLSALLPLPACRYPSFTYRFPSSHPSLPVPFAFLIPFFTSPSPHLCLSLPSPSPFYCAPSSHACPLLTAVSRRYP